LKDDVYEFFFLDDMSN